MNAAEIKRFKRFLKEEGIFKLFIKRYDPKYRTFGRWFVEGDGLNIEGNNIEATRENIINYLSHIVNANAIFSAFEWNFTNEGFDYWEKINSEWINLQIKPDKI